ncbi:unnamed protein product [Phyllotreta striolata]|uniref:C2H2-type domain-containing protein n=1 Tax=Phyllotreta striolata TaxID=444603 RepID=A0A9N9TL37_PHYSR|nr:unnamed protein product [Phyllotreta striolata]
MKHISILILLVYLTSSASSLRCYECFIASKPFEPHLHQNIHRNLCVDFDSSQNFLKECPNSTFCTKTIYTADFHGPKTGVERGCAHQVQRYMSRGRSSVGLDKRKKSIGRIEVAGERIRRDYQSEDTRVRPREDQDRAEKSPRMKRRERGERRPGAMRQRPAFCMRPLSSAGSSACQLAAWSCSRYIEKSRGSARCSMRSSGGSNFKNLFTHLLTILHRIELVQSSRSNSQRGVFEKNSGRNDPLVPIGPFEICKFPLMALIS